jgi:hypothetical protein
MNLAQYIILLLEEFHQVTLPFLGKFELEFISVTSDESTKKTYPPGYIISFSQQHDLNDLSVIRRIAKMESLNEEEVEIKVRQSISDWKETLKTTHFLSIDKFGILTSEKEKITFKMSEDCIFNFKNFGLPSI